MENSCHRSPALALANRSVATQPLACYSAYCGTRMPPHSAMHRAANVEHRVSRSAAVSANMGLHICRLNSVLCRRAAAAPISASALWQSAAAGMNCRPQLRSSNRSIAPAPRAMRAVVPVPNTTDEAIILLERLQRTTLATGSEHGMNLVVFGGGFAATLVAFLVHSVFEERCAAVFVRMPGTTDADFSRTQYLASFLGMELWQLQPAAPHGPDSSDAGGSLLSNGTELALGVELGAFDGSVDLGDLSGSESSDDEDAESSPVLSGAIKALQAAFWDRDGPPVVVFDGLHADDLPASDQDDASWDGSLDFGEQLGASYRAASEAVDTEPDLLSGTDSANSGNDAAATMGSCIVKLPGLPSGRRVSLLAGLSEIGVRAVADLAGMPNWDWVPDAEVAPQPDSNGSRPLDGGPSSAPAGTTNTSAAQPDGQPQPQQLRSMRTAQVLANCR